jgi:hypothetical protein
VLKLGAFTSTTVTKEMIVAACTNAARLLTQQMLVIW